MGKEKTIALVDADLLCFRAAAAGEKRSIIVKHNKSGQEKEFEGRTAFNKLLKEKFGDKYKEAKSLYTIDDIQEAAPISYPLHAIKTRVDKIKFETRADEIELYLGESESFRSKLPLPSLYKGNREDFIRPVHLEDCRGYAQYKLGATVAKGIEADDLLNIRAYEEIAKGNKAIICSLDKDTYQSEGICVYNWTLDNPTVDLIPLIGDIHYLGPNDVKGTGFKFLAYQLIWGDPVDNYKPCQVSGVKFGAKTAYNALKEAQDGHSIAQVVVDTYKKWYGSGASYTAWDGSQQTKTWEEMLDLYFQCAYMLRSHMDKTTWKEFFIQRGWKE